MISYIKKKQTEKILARKFFYIVLFCFVIYLTGYLINFFMHKKVASVLLEYANEDDINFYTGLIIRNEKIYKTQHDGVLCMNIKNNELAKKNFAICVIKFESNILGESEKVFKNTGDAHTQDSIEKLNKFMSNIKKNLSLAQEIKKNQEEIIRAHESGLVSYITDGLEEILVPNNFEFDLHNLKTQRKENHENIFLNSGDIVFKIIESNEWYLVGNLSNLIIKKLDLKEQDTHVIYINDELLETEALIEKIIARDEKYNYVFFKLNEYVQEYIAKRVIKFKLKNKNLIGLKIPVSAIVKINLLKIPKSFVIINNTKEYYLEKINTQEEIYVLDSDKNFYYIKQDKFKLGDLIIHEDKKYKITESKKIRGVYIANDGIAEFKKINYQEEILDREFIILDLELNKNIKIGDRVIIEPDKISDGEKIIN